MLTLGGRNILEATLTLPIGGAWLGSGELEGSTALEGAQTLSTGGAEFVGMVSSEPYGSRTGFELVGGAGTLGQILRPQSYRGCPLSMPLGDVLRQIGQSVDSIDSSLGNHILASWTLGAWSAGRCLTELTEVVGATWQILDSGLFWFGVPSWEATASKFELVGHDTQGRVLTVAPAEGEGFRIRPGTLVDGKQITEVRYVIKADSIRSHLEY